LDLENGFYNNNDEVDQTIVLHSSDEGNEMEDE
jgi:hypothetical protein